VTSDVEHEGPREFWRERAAEYGLEVGEEVLDEEEVEGLTDESDLDLTPVDDEDEPAGGTGTGRD
jgi:CPA1 family monovalent cation:H+ antiporter